MSRRREAILRPVNITKQRRIEVVLMDGWRRGVKGERGEEKRGVIFHSSLPVCRQVRARIIKELKNVRGVVGNESLITLIDQEQRRCDELQHCQGHENRIIQTIKVFCVHP